MPDETAGGGEAATTVEATETTTTEVKEETFDEARARKTIEAQRESERAAIARAKEAERELKELKKRDEASAAEKKTAEERLEALEAQIASGNQRVGKQAIRAAATQAGANYPEDIPALIDMSALKFDDDGEPLNADELVEALKKSKPGHFGTVVPGSADGGARGGGDGGKGLSMDDRLREAAGR